MTEKNREQTGKDVRRLKKVWEELQHRQETAAGRKSKAAGAIASVELVDDGRGAQTVLVKTVAGGKITDSGEKSAEFSAMASQQTANVYIPDLEALMAKVREHGFDEVAGSLPPEVAKALKKACLSAGIDMKGQEDKREAEARQAAAMAAAKKQAEHSARANDASKKQEKSPEDELNALMASAKHTAINTRRAQTGLYITKNKLINEQRKRCRCEKEKLRQKYNALQIEEYRQELYGEGGKAKIIEEKLANGQPLTKDEQRLWSKKERYGITESSKTDKPTPEQKRARNKMSARDYSKNLLKQYREDISRKNAICNTKIGALECTAAHALMDLAQGKKVDVSMEAVVDKATKMMPAREQLTTSHLADVQKRFKKHKEKIRTTTLLIREERKKDIELKLQKAVERMKDSSLHRALTNKGKQPVHREPLTLDAITQAKQRGMSR